MSQGSWSQNGDSAGLKSLYEVQRKVLDCAEVKLRGRKLWNLRLLCNAIFMLEYEQYEINHNCRVTHLL